MPRTKRCRGRLQAKWRLAKNLGVRAVVGPMGGGKQKGANKERGRVPPFALEREGHKSALALAFRSNVKNVLLISIPGATPNMASGGSRAGYGLEYEVVGPTGIRHEARVGFRIGLRERSQMRPGLIRRCERVSKQVFAWSGWVL